MYGRKAKHPNISNTSVFFSFSLSSLQFSKTTPPPKAATETSASKKPTKSTKVSSPKTKQKIPSKHKSAAKAKRSFLKFFANPPDPYFSGHKSPVKGKVKSKKHK